MKKKFKQISVLVCAFLLSICFLGVDYSEAYSSNYKQVTIWIHNATDANGTATLKLHSTGETYTLNPNRMASSVFYVKMFRKSDKVTITFKNGTFSNGKSTPVKSFKKTMTIKPGATYSLTPKTKIKKYTNAFGANVTTGSKGSVYLKNEYKYGYKF